MKRINTKKQTNQAVGQGWASEARATTGCEDWSRDGDGAADRITTLS